MQEKLQPLIKKYKDKIGVSKEFSDGQLYFRYLLQKYLKDEQNVKAAFQERTSLGKNVYYKLSGSSKEKRVEPIKDETLLDVAIGLRLTYEESVVLFWLFGKNLLCDYEYMQQMNEELLQLDIMWYS